MVFAPVDTGDAVFLDTGERLYLIDCGLGIDYAASVKALGFRSVSGLVLTHAHMDHWTALPDILDLLAPDAWVARSGALPTSDLMRRQSTFEFYDGEIDRDRVLDAWDSLPQRARLYSGLPDDPGLPMWDANASSSSAEFELHSSDSRDMHHYCIVPVVEWGNRVALFGADLDAEDWPKLAPRLPPDVDLFQAPNHGGPPGRMDRWVLDEHLTPDVIVVTDAQPCDNDHRDWYVGDRREVHTLHDRKTIVATLSAAGCRVETGALELPRA